MQRPNFFIAPMLLCAISLAVGGCRQAPPAATAPATAPTGFALVQDAATLAKGTQLFNPDGTPFATVVSHDDNYKFLGGKTGKGTELKMAAPPAAAGAAAPAGKPAPAPDGGSFWLPDEFITAKKCVKS